MIKVLIIEDEFELASMLAKFLLRDGMSVELLHDGSNAVEHIKTHSPDIVLLDVMLPGMNGIDICREVRKFSSVPIIMTTAKVDEVDRLLGFEIGADDYICKPYSSKEVVVRVKNILRLYNFKKSEQPDGFVLDKKQYAISFKGTNIELSHIEFQIFSLLYNNPGQIFSRDHIIDRVYVEGKVISYRTIDSHIKNLRKKIKQIITDKECIRAVYGVGYKYEPVMD
ncbi:response regulator [Pleionea sp. CnH1-48]|uniref:response regulator n=1 Tax=Pleionea sp. CnH1-48 TaxID=2954494 RepID=UPI0020969716|nr:response regulator [Pleionea sp. CnH1-48]MCO7224910.1 response regulator [Pleionea sp. CnH1-48]